MKAWIGKVKDKSRETNSQNVTADPELAIRTSWVDAETGYKLVQQGVVEGNRPGLLVRSYLQHYLYKLGCFQQRHSGKIVIVGLLILCLLSVGLKTAVVESDISKLWVPEGGRLSEELEYTKSILGDNFGSTSQIILQTPGEGSRNVLTKQSLLQHLQAVVKATQVQVHLFDRVWDFEDICFKTTFPSFENGLVDMMLEKMSPCVIISPLDCFWEGSIALGPKIPVMLPPSIGHEPLTWKNLNPWLLMSVLRSTIPGIDVIEETLHRAGIADAYQNKPCLDPLNPECSPQAPNYLSVERDQSPAAVLTGGCSGISDVYMHWQEDMIIGGVVKNRSNTVVSAQALQTIVQLMGETELYNYYQGTYAVSSIDWSPEKARQIIEVFQKKFSEAVVAYNQMENVTDSISSFTEASLDDLIDSFTEISYLRLGLGYAIMLIYSALSLMNVCNAVQSHANVGIAGIVLVTLSVAAGLGLSSLLHLPFNAMTTQIVPFVALGLGVDNMFLIVHTFAQTPSTSHTDLQDEAGKLLKKVGPAVLLSSVCTSGAFLIAAIVPVPALRTFALQMGAILTVNMISMVLIFPAVLSLDAWRKSSGRLDVFCCFESPQVSKVKDISVLPPPSPPDNPKHDTVTFTPNTGEQGVMTVLAPSDYGEYEASAGFSTSSQNLTDGSHSPSPCCQKSFSQCCTPSLDWLVNRFYLPMIDKMSFRVIVSMVTVVLACTAAYGVSKLKVGMELTDVVPRGSNEHTFLQAQSEYFGFYNMYIVTKSNIEYQDVVNQKLLKELHGDIRQVDNVMADDTFNGALWLDLMTSWLKDLQKSYDAERQWFHSTGWNESASDFAVLAYTLIIQTGDVDEPLDRTRYNRVRLVDENGLIRSDAFYNYLTAWVYNDPLAYDLSQATIRPLPKGWYYSSKHAVNLFIPRAQAIDFARISYYLHNLSESDEFLKTIQEIRDICDAYTGKGVESYPSGMLFTYWEQYLHIDVYALTCLLTALAVIFLFITLATMSPLAAALVIITLAVITYQLLGVMGLAGVKISAVPVVVLVVSVGVGVVFTVHIVDCYMTSVGNRVLRVKRSLSYIFTPAVHGAVTTFLGVIVLALSEFDFIIRYFFLGLLTLVVLGTYTILLFFPVLLSMVGPAAQVQPEDKNATMVEIPKPASPPPPCKRSKRRSSRKTKRSADADVLSTIAEEPSQFSSSSSCEQEVAVKPQVSVATTLTPEASTPSPARKPRSKQRRRPMTKLKTTVTVEVHTDLPGCASDISPCRQQTRAQRKECRCSESDESETSV